MTDCNVHHDPSGFRPCDDNQCSLKSPSLREETPQVAAPLFVLDVIETIRHLIDCNLGLETRLQ